MLQSRGAARRAARGAPRSTLAPDTAPVNTIRGAGGRRARRRPARPPARWRSARRRPRWACSSVSRFSARIRSASDGAEAMTRSARRAKALLGGEERGRVDPLVGGDVVDAVVDDERRDRARRGAPPPAARSSTGPARPPARPAPRRGARSHGSSRALTARTAPTECSGSTSGDSTCRESSARRGGADPAAHAACRCRDAGHARRGWGAAGRATRRTGSAAALQPGGTSGAAEFVHSSVVTKSGEPRRRGRLSRPASGVTLAGSGGRACARTPPGPLRSRRGARCRARSRYCATPAPACRRR